jgi:hypothetical protein
MILWTSSERVVVDRRAYPSENESVGGTLILFRLFIKSSWDVVMMNRNENPAMERNRSPMVNAKSIPTRVTSECRNPIPAEKYTGPDETFGNKLSSMMMTARKGVTSRKARVSFFSSPEISARTRIPVKSAIMVSIEVKKRAARLTRRSVRIFVLGSSRCRRESPYS